MNNLSSPKCPFHADEKPSSPRVDGTGSWPPGPPAGLTGSHLMKGMSRDLIGTLADWHQTYGDMVCIRVFWEREILVADPSLVRELLVGHHDLLVRWRRGIDVFKTVDGHSVFTSEGRAWQEKRRVLQPVFHRQSVQSFLPEIVSATDQSITRWQTGGRSFPIQSALTSLTMDVILRLMVSEAIGKDVQVIEEALDTIRRAVNAELYQPVSLPDWMPWKWKKRKAVALVRGFLDRHIQARLRTAEDRWPDDLLSRLLHLHRAAPDAWPLKTAQDECMTAFNAGHATTAISLAWWSWCMASNPAAQTQARAEVRRVLRGEAMTIEKLGELRFLTQTLEETLRLYPAAPVLFARRLTKPMSLGPWQVPSGTLMAIPVHVLHHDPRWFPDPEAFRPERFGPEAAEIPRGAFLPFGAGPRVCLGQNLAMMEMTVAAAMLLQRFELSVPDGMPPPKAVMHIMLQPSNPLHLRLNKLDI